MSERNLHRLLRSGSLPQEAEARERSWRVVRAAFDAREPLPRHRRRLVPGLALAAGLAVLAAALSPPGRAVLGELRTRVAGEEGRALTALPAPGRLLVAGPGGAWIVNADGSKRRLGAYSDATWSPHGLYVAAARGNHLVAVDPKGEVRWTVTRRDIADPRWAPSGFRVAYRSGLTLRVVIGNGKGDRSPFDELVAPIAPAWRPGQRHVLAFVDRGWRLHVWDTDTGAKLWEAPVGPSVRSIQWSSDGRRLLVVSPQVIEVIRAPGRVVTAIRLPRTHVATSAAFKPGTHHFAYAVMAPRARKAQIRFFRGGSTLLFAGSGPFRRLTWSPRGRWLLAAWPQADQWLFLRAPGVRRVVAVSNVAREFDPGSDLTRGFPRLAGWCCTAQGPAG
jgi:hypothetical protein